MSVDVVIVSESECDLVVGDLVVLRDRGSPGANELALRVILDAAVSEGLSPADPAGARWFTLRQSP